MFAPAVAYGLKVTKNEEKLTKSLFVEIYPIHLQAKTKQTRKCYTVQQITSIGGVAYNKFSRKLAQRTLSVKTNRMP